MKNQNQSRQALHPVLSVASGVAGSHMHDQPPADLYLYLSQQATSNDVWHCSILIGLCANLYI